MERQTILVGRSIKLVRPIYFFFGRYTFVGCLSSRHFTDHNKGVSCQHVVNKRYLECCIPQHNRPKDYTCIGPATCCDATHPRWNVLKPLRCIKIACDALRWVFQHVGISAPDFGISLLFIVLFSNGLDHCDGHLIGFH